VLPYIDTAFRQLPDRGQDAEEEMSPTVFFSSSFAERPATPSAALPVIATSVHRDAAWSEAGERGSTLSARELEVMKWVRMGKTNSEIAIILSLSMFTVKNHMRLIYKKLDVLNRAQAVGSLDAVYTHPPGDARR
jgi:DNA-binding CsgD family transcriptional regulator